jgi:iron complex outermembrane receptor protein
MCRAGLTALRVLGCAWLLTTAARAQQGGVLLEEVLVTAEKKSAAESAQTVPISIAAYSGKQVEAMFAISLTDVGLSTPNVSLTAIPTFPGVANFVIRGMGTVGQSIPSADPAVGVFIDGIALGTIYGVVTDLFDLESIEILRGPQGTLFGRNVTGGAILLRSKRPAEEFEGSVRATVGSYSQRDLALTLSGPISEDWGGKIAVLRKDHDDYWDNHLLGVRQGDSQTLLVRPALSYKRGAFDATAIFEYGKMEGDGLSAITWWADGAQVLDPYAERVSLQDTIGYSNLKWISGSLEANWDLWEGQLTAVLGLRDLEQRMESDIDGYSGDRFEFAPGTRLDQDQQSIELRWSGDLGEKVTLTTGLYGFQQEYTYAERRFLNRAVDRRGVSTIAHDTQAVFAQADWRLADKVTLTIGGRYTSEEKDAEIGVIGDPGATGDCATTPPPFSPTTPALSDCAPALVDNKSWSNFGPKIGANWAIMDDVMVYADYSRGFRSGGYNVRFTDMTYITNPTSRDRHQVDFLRRQGASQRSHVPESI